MGGGMQQHQNRRKTKAVRKETEKEKDTGTPLSLVSLISLMKPLRSQYAEQSGWEAKRILETHKCSVFKVRESPIDKVLWKTWWKLVNIINQGRATQESAQACQLPCALPQPPENYHNLSGRHVKMQGSFEDAYGDYWSLLNCSWRTSL